MSIRHSHQMHGYSNDASVKEDISMSNTSTTSNLPIEDTNQFQYSHKKNNYFIPQRADVCTPISITTPPPPDDLLNQLTKDELISRIRSLEAKNRKLLYDNGSMTKDINHHLSMLQSVKQQNYQLLNDNNELRDLCCYLDDERNKARIIAREWQSFGTYLRNEVTNYSAKVSRLENMQYELIRENFELKQLCLLLDSAITQEGDNELTSEDNHESANYRTPQQQQHRVIISQQILEYMRSLEQKIQQFEWEKRQLTDRHSNIDTIDSFENNSVATSDHNPTSSCPASILKAMQVLRIRETLEANKVDKETPSTNENEENGNVPLEKQKAIVNGLCNVVWRKIEDGS